jgi:hypothetical protein
MGLALVYFEGIRDLLHIDMGFTLRIMPKVWELLKYNMGVALEI